MFKYYVPVETDRKKTTLIIFGIFAFISAILIIITSSANINKSNDNNTIKYLIIINLIFGIILILISGVMIYYGTRSHWYFTTN